MARRPSRKASSLRPRPASIKARTHSAGWDIAQKIPALDIGQTVIVKNGAVLAIEGFDGTNETMRRGGALGRGGAVMIKVAKPNQDMRFDIPVIGRETISVAAEAKIRVIALEASPHPIAGKTGCNPGCAERENFPVWPLSRNFAAGLA